MKEILHTNYFLHLRNTALQLIKTVKCYLLKYANNSDVHRRKPNLQILEKSEQNNSKVYDYFKFDLLFLPINIFFSFSEGEIQFPRVSLAVYLIT